LNPNPQNHPQVSQKAYEKEGVGRKKNTTQDPVPEPGQSFKSVMKHKTRQHLGC